MVEQIANFDPSSVDPFLLLLDGLVRRDGGLSGLSGEVCVGVRRAEEIQWWSARFGESFGTDFLNQPSSTANTTWLIPSDQAAALVGGRTFAPETCHLVGDQELFRKFINRYTSKTSLLGLRVRNAQGG